MIQNVFSALADKANSSFHEESFLRVVNKELTKHSPKLSQRDINRRSKFVAGRKLTPPVFSHGKCTTFL